MRLPRPGFRSARSRFRRNAAIEEERYFQYAVIIWVSERKTVWPQEFWQQMECLNYDGGDAMSVRTERRS